MLNWSKVLGIIWGFRVASKNSGDGMEIEKESRWI